MRSPCVNDRVVWCALLAALAATSCRRDAGPPDAGPARAAVSPESCRSCHGASGPKAASDLRKPGAMATRSDADLAAAVRSNPAHEFGPRLAEAEIGALVDALRESSVSLADCFPDATGWVQLSAVEDREPVLAAYAAGARPASVIKDSELPNGAPLLGLVLFAQSDAPRSGTQVALMVDPSGELLGVRAALPHSEKLAAQASLEGSLRGQGAPSPQLSAKLERLKAVAVELSK